MRREDPIYYLQKANTAESLFLDKVVLQRKKYNENILFFARLLLSFHNRPRNKRALIAHLVIFDADKFRQR
jgi:hypothetical protein